MRFKKAVDESNRKPNQIWVDKGTKSFLYNNEGKYIMNENLLLLKNSSEP